jgi:hypothetical protein
MPDEGPEHGAGWNIQTQHIYTHRVIADLKEHLTERIDAERRFYDQRIHDMEVLHESEIRASNAAIQKVAEETERTRSMQNEWRGTLSDQATQFATKPEVEAVEKIAAALSSRMDRNEGKGLGANSLWAIAATAIVVIGVIVGMFYKLK